MKKFLVLLVSGLAALAGAADPLGSSSRTCRLLYVQAPLDAPDTVVLVIGKETTDVDLPPCNSTALELVQEFRRRKATDPYRR